MNEPRQLQPQSRPRRSHWRKSPPGQPSGSSGTRLFPALGQLLPGPRSPGGRRLPRLEIPASALASSGPGDFRKAQELISILVAIPALFMTIPAVGLARDRTSGVASEAPAAADRLPESLPGEARKSPAARETSEARQTANLFSSPAQILRYREGLDSPPLRIGTGRAFRHFRRLPDDSGGCPHAINAQLRGLDAPFRPFRPRPPGPRPPTRPSLRTLSGSRSDSRVSGKVSSLSVG
jgi:hypothetical protein